MVGLRLRLLSWQSVLMSNPAYAWLSLIRYSTCMTREQLRKLIRLALMYCMMQVCTCSTMRNHMLVRVTVGHSGDRKGGAWGGVR